jgi:hypothetical protein
LEKTKPFQHIEFTTFKAAARSKGPRECLLSRLNPAAKSSLPKIKAKADPPANTASTGEAKKMTSKSTKTQLFRNSNILKRFFFLKKKLPADLHRVEQ